MLFTISLHPKHIIENQLEPPLMAGFWMESWVSQVRCGQKLHGDRIVPVWMVHRGVRYSGSGLAPGPDGDETIA